MFLFGIEYCSQNKSQLLATIKNEFIKKRKFCHIASLNPEIIVAAEKDFDFFRCLQKAEIKIIDGIGVMFFARLLSSEKIERITGADLMMDLMKMAQDLRLKVMFIGGQPKIAPKLIDRQKKLFPDLSIKAITGIRDKKLDYSKEEKLIWRDISNFKPNIVFVAYGSPFTEKWIDRNRDKFKKMVVMNVGGGIDFFAGSVSRAPVWMRKIGLEWIWRLINQPSRITRQINLLFFLFIAFKKTILQKMKIISLLI